MNYSSGMGLKDTGTFLFTLRALDGSSIDEMMSNLPTPGSLSDLEQDARYFSVMDMVDRSFSVEVGRWGTIYGYKQEQNGTRIQNLFPIKRHENEQISSSSKVLLEMHTETAFHPYKPETLVLLCVRGDSKAGTNYSHLPDILKQLDDDTKNQLRQPLFTTALDASFTIESSNNTRVITSVLSNGDSELIFDRDLMRGTTDQAQEALESLADAVDATKNTIYLETGQVLAINNKTIVHGRTPFEPRYDGTDRWLKRALIRSTPPPPSEVVCKGINKVITTDF